MPQPDECNICNGRKYVTQEGWGAKECLCLIRSRTPEAKLKQAIDDVKLLRKAYGELKVVTCSHEDHRGLVVRPPQDVYNGLSIMHALAATDRPEYKEEG